MSSITAVHSADAQERDSERWVKFRKELMALLNRCSMEQDSDTPDYILADYLCDCLAAFNAAVNHRDGGI